MSDISKAKFVAGIGDIIIDGTINSIGDVIVNHDLTDYSLMSGRYSLIYNIHNNGTLKSMNITTKNHVVPTININKSLINEGEGTIENPYVINY